MPVLWVVVTSIESLQASLELQDAIPPRLTWVNEDARFAAARQIEEEYAAHVYTERELLAFRAMPTPILQITDPFFHFDYFDLGVVFASEKLRSALDLNEHIVSYRDIDVSQSTPNVQAQHYQAMQVMNFANPVDLNKTPGTTLTTTLPDGSVQHDWILFSRDQSKPQRIYWRDDFVAPAPLFRVFGSAWTLATDELADKVMRAGIKDFMFQDVTSDRAQTELVFRQL